jgi:hypothetical protein
MWLVCGQSLAKLVGLGTNPILYRVSSFNLARKSMRQLKSGFNKVENQAKAFLLRLTMASFALIRAVTPSSPLRSCVKISTQIAAN